MLSLKYSVYVKKVKQWRHQGLQAKGKIAFMTAISPRLYCEISLVRPVTGGVARGAFAPPQQAPAVRILILNIQVKECSRLNWIKFQT